MLFINIAKECWWCTGKNGTAEYYVKNDDESPNRAVCYICKSKVEYQLRSLTGKEIVPIPNMHRGIPLIAENVEIDKYHANNMSYKLQPMLNDYISHGYEILRCDYYERLGHNNISYIGYNLIFKKKE